MPLYTSHCSSCGTDHSYVRTISNRNDTPHCCGKSTDKVLDTPMIGAMAFGGHKGFLANATSTPQWLESGADVKRYMKENKLVPQQEGAERAADAKRNQEIAFDRSLDNAIHAAREKHRM